MRSSLIEAFFGCLCALSLAACSAQDEDKGSVGATSQDVQSAELAEGEFCRLSTEFRRLLLYNDRGEVIEGYPGHYNVISSQSLDELIFEQEYVADYAKAIEQKMLDVAGEVRCAPGQENLTLKIDFVELSLYHSITVDQLPQSAQIVYDHSNNVLTGVFGWNPLQILADQYWLHEGVVIPPEEVFFTYTQFYDWGYQYHLFLEQGSEHISEAELQALIPAQVYWLFQISPQSTRALFGGFALETWGKILAHSAANYEQILEITINQNSIMSLEGGDRILSDIVSVDQLQTYKYPLTN